MINNLYCALNSQFHSFFLNTLEAFFVNSKLFKLDSADTNAMNTAELEAT